MIPIEGLISVRVIPSKWLARNTLNLYFTTGDTNNHWSPQITFGEKQKTDKPIVVLADLPHCYQGLQVLVGLVRVDVVQRAAVPGVSIGGCEVNGNLVEGNVKHEQYDRIHSVFILLLDILIWLLMIL